MENFEKASIITEVAFKKNTSRFIPRNEQVMLNTQLKEKLLRFVKEMVVEENRPNEMKLFDAMMNEMHGQRVKDLYNYRKEGNHIVSLLCNAIPPELIYGLDHHIPVSVCMGAGELESYVDKETQGMCSLSRSIVGFQKTGMCVLFNVSDYVIGTDLCSCIKKSTDIIAETSDEFNVFCTHSSQLDDKIDAQSLLAWLKQNIDNDVFSINRLLEYCKIYSELRELYKSIFSLRKSSNPPINGRNSLWIQQLFLVEEPKKLLSAMQRLNLELLENARRNIGFNEHGKKKRVMLISPRIMPPFTEIFRLIENNNAIIVYEQTCMGILNVGYQYHAIENRLLSAYNNEEIEKTIHYILNSIDTSVCSCFSDFEIDRIEETIREYQIEAVINYSFKSCPKMFSKTNKINELLNQRGIPSMVIQTDYMEIYENEQKIMQDISSFLRF